MERKETQRAVVILQQAVCVCVMCALFVVYWLLSTDAADLQRSQRIKLRVHCNSLSMILLQ